MGWLQRLRGGSAEHALSPAVERATPGVAALFAGLSADQSHSVLDLGPASDSSLHVYGRFARRVRFAGLTAVAASDEWSSALAGLPAQPDHPYDLVLAWDVLDRLDKGERAGLVQRLAEVTAKDARLHMVVDASPATGATGRMVEPVRFTLLDIDRVRCEPTGPAHPAPRPLLPAEVERLLAPFQVVGGFTLKVGVREYLAVRREARRSTSSGSSYRA
jgi:hypothetical protein